MVASCVLLLTLVFLSESALGMRPLSETTSGADKALQMATIFRMRNGAERRLLANSFMEATDALGMAMTLVGPNSLLALDASSVVYTGATSASGIFQLDASHALNSEYGISSGVVLTTGPGELSIAIENDDDFSTISSLGDPGDSLLSQMINGPTSDASVLDFKGTAQGSGQLTFQYVFGSDEYLGNLLQFNDIVALFVKVGNGAFTPSDNVALASDGKAVSLSNVNPNSNAAQYVDNPALTGTHHIAYDGYTTLLTTSPISVTTGDTVHIRLAIADTQIGVIDSAVYVVANSIVIAPTPTPTPTPTTPVPTTPVPTTPVPTTPAPTTPAPTTPVPTTPVPTTPAPTTPAPTPGPISTCADRCDTASSAPNRCCNSEGSLGLCCPGLCGPSTPNSDGTTNPTCLRFGGASPGPVPTTPVPTTPVPTTPVPTTPVPTTAPTPAPTGPLQSCTNEFCNPFGALPNKCCNAAGVTMRCCPGQCGPNIVNDGVSTPTCL